MELGEKDCPQNMAKECRVSCNTCCGDVKNVVNKDGNPTNKNCAQSIADLQKIAGEDVACTDLLKDQCAESCQACPSDAHFKITTSSTTSTTSTTKQAETSTTQKAPETTQQST